jgi:hypothetical protein
MSTQHFTKLLETTKDLLGRDRFKNIILDNGLELSVKAGVMNYCSPRTSGLSPEEYTEFEVAVLRGGKIIDPNSNVTRTSQRDGDIFPYLDCDLVQELYEELNSLSEEQVKNL